MFKNFRVFSLLAVCLSLAGLAVAQSSTPDPDSENAPVQHAKATSAGPLVINWHFKNDAGLANLTINSDGTWIFSGNYNKKKANRDFDIAMALKSSTGAVIVYHFIGNDADGAQWSKQGKSDILKDDFQTFASKHDWTGVYRFPLSSEGRAKLYEEREKKKAELRKEEEEAHKRHDEKVAAEKKAEREKQEREEREEAQQAAAQHQQNNGGGGGVLDTISSVASTVGDVVSTISSVGNAIASLF